MLETHNNYRFNQSDSSLYTEFIAYEKQFLLPLSSPYQVREFRNVTVQKMGYIYLSEDKHYYSIPISM